METITDSKQLWENVLVDIELSISKANFSTWFKDTSISKIEDGIVSLSVSNEFVRDWLSNKYHKNILRALRSCDENVRGLEYVIRKDGRKREVTPPSVNRPQMNSALPLENFYINKNDNLNPRYIFDTFVVGPFNELAHAAAQAIVQKPGITYNPLFIYGQTGVGKTHLIQAVGNQLKKMNENQKVYYVTSERFTMDLVNSIQSGKVNQFKDKYRQYDVLIMDDIQFLSGKEKTQEELFHLFNALYDNNKQILFSSDKHVNYIPDLEDRLKSRFAAGMIVDIPAPDQESRTAILRAKIGQNNFSLGDDIVEYLATTIQGNIRDLEGTLNSIICQSQLKGRELSLTEVKTLIKDNAKPKKLVSVVDVIQKVASFYNIDESSIYEKTRRKEVVRPRQLIMYILREDFSVSFPSIGQKLGGRDHTTVIHSCDKVRNELKTDSNLNQELSQIRMLLT
ncbi:MAG TPA: chromosomal replication initiator protein DnaA [Candidatus Paceibacterota bacterium]|jgi:chromosomal replication initiator protein